MLALLLAGWRSARPSAVVRAASSLVPALGGTRSVTNTNISPAMSEPAASSDQPNGTAEQEEVLFEGRAKIIKQGNNVFYNEAQVTNRDLSVAVLRKFLPQLAHELSNGTVKRKPKTYQPQHNAAASGGTNSTQGAHLLEGLAASGLRSIRYALELDGVARIDANDLDPAVVESMRRNISANGPDAAAKVQPHCSDARMLMLQNPYTYDVIDLDPYGTPAHLLDTAMQSVADGGLLAVTATDMAVLCGNNGEVCWTKYGSYPLHRPYCHESAIRILLGCLERHANTHKRYIVPLLSVQMDFYVRVFVRVFTSPGEIKRSASKQAYVWQSLGCDSWWLQPVGDVVTKGNSTKFAPSRGPALPSMTCPESGSGFLMGGPIWSQPLHDMEWVGGLLQQMEQEAGRYAQHARIKGILTAVLEELPDVPLYYDIHEMCKKVRCTAPKSENFRSGIINAGFRVSGSHANPLALKTDAPPQVVWDVVRSWIKRHPVKDPEPNSYAAAILGKEIETQIDFKRAQGAVPRKAQKKVPRFVQNPAHWGPKARHGKPLKREQQLQQEVQAQQRRSRQQQMASAAGGGEGGGSGSPGPQQPQSNTPPNAAQQQQQTQPRDLDNELDELYAGVGEPDSRPSKRHKPPQQQQQPQQEAGVSTET